METGPQAVLARAIGGLNTHIEALLTGNERDTAPLYAMLRYFFGFLEEDLMTAAQKKGGKRLRPALTFLLAEGYGHKEAAREAALAVELFHNFTLIHDDIEDGDELRRGKPTLWKLCGTDHAINAGDQLSLIASQAAMRAGPDAARILFSAFMEVVDGQYMDFELARAKNPRIDRDWYERATEKKTGALMGAATEVAGICTDQSPGECARLRTFGRSLGIAFQYANDFRSVWSTQEETGKDAYGDIRERKRTLPYFLALETGADTQLAELYALDRQLTESEIAQAHELLEQAAAKEQTLAAVREHIQNATKVIQSLALPQETKNLLVALIPTLIPEASE